MKIPIELIPKAYEISKKVYNGQLTVTEGANQLADKDRMKLSSARDYIYDYRCLVQGKKFTRTLNSPSMHFFLENLLQDNGLSNLDNPLSALKKHIDYYEKKQSTTMHLMREIHDKYSALYYEPKFITNINGLITNIKRIENYLTEGSSEERLAASNLIKRGTCFVSYKIGTELRFAPSRFLGYKSNSLSRHNVIVTDGRKTNRVIKSILNSPLKVGLFENEYIDYCIKLGINPQLKGGAFGVKRKYWHLELKEDFQENLVNHEGFPEGKVVERMHKVRERNSKVIELAKKNFKKKYGRLFCQICKFDFQKKYGIIGEDYIEGHHTIPVSEMPPDYKTKAEEIAMLCCNCHRMVHKRRPWLKMQELERLLKQRK